MKYKWPVNIEKKQNPFGVQGNKKIKAIMK